MTLCSKIRLPRPQAWLLGLILLALAGPALAAEKVHEPTGYRIFTSDYDSLFALDPATGRVVWSRRLLDSGSAGLVPIEENVWLLVGKDFLEAFRPADGQKVWRYDLKGLEPSLVWGPELLPGAEKDRPGTLYFTVQSRQDPARGGDPRRSQWALYGLLAANGQEKWKVDLPSPQGQGLFWGQDLLLTLKPVPPPPPGGYLRLREEPQTPEPQGETVRLVSGADGKTLWEVKTRGRIRGGPWLAGELALYEEERQGPGGALSSLLVALDTRGREVWTRQVAGSLSQPPVAEEGALELWEAGEKTTVVRLDLATGRPLWSHTLSGETLLREPFEGRLALFYKTEREGRKATQVSYLDPTSGTATPGPLLEGEATAVLAHQGKLYVLLKTTLQEESLDPSGRVIMDLVADKPRMRVVEGLILAEIQDSGSRVLWADPRTSATGSLTPLDGYLLLATQTVPPQQKGQRRSKKPEPILLRAIDPATGQAAWTYRPPTEQALASDVRWLVHQGKVLVSTEKGQVVALDAGTGKEIWVTPRRFAGGVGPIQPLKEGLYFISGKGVAVLLDPASGQVRWQVRLSPLFQVGKLNNLIGVLLLAGAIAWYIYHARRRDLFIRRIAGLNAIDEAVGRSTEMGKPVLYVIGLADIDDIQTLAALSLLGHVARKTAEYDTPILVPCNRSVVMSTAQEVVKEAYTSAGRPDAFNRDNIRYLTDDQFGFVAGVDGIMLRDRPAANFYMGMFFAESLILAETGYSTGAIQIAGTAAPTQLPFFVAACDYTLIGEELYAASAYLSRDPLQVGSLKGQDAGKAIIMVALFLGTLLLSFGYTFVKEWFRS